MTVNAQTNEYKSVIGLDNLYIAEVTEDSASAYTTDTPEYLAPSAELSAEPTVNSVTQYADDQPYEVVTSEGETKLTVKITGIPFEMLAKLTGKVYDAATGRVLDSGSATPPYFALSFRSLKSSGGYRYYQYFKGRFDTPKEEATTKGDSPDLKTVELVYTAIRTVYKWDLDGSITDSVKRLMGDTDSVNFDPSGWFSAVQTPGFTAPSALALSSSTPTDGGTGFVVSSNLTLTFNNALPDSALDNIILMLDSTGAIIAGAYSLDTTKKIVTINPSSNLAASSAYTVVLTVRDVYGQLLQDTVSFQTA